MAPNGKWVPVVGDRTVRPTENGGEWNCKVLGFSLELGWYERRVCAYLNKNVEIALPTHTHSAVVKDITVNGDHSILSARTVGWTVTLDNEQ